MITITGTTMTMTTGTTTTIGTMGIIGTERTRLPTEACHSLRRAV
jgi:hypothetical protein